MDNFLEEQLKRLKSISENIDLGPVIEEIKQISKESKKELFVRKYNIHKRSLPVGIDKIVVFNVTKEVAEWLTEKRLKSKIFFNDPDDSKTVIYYDIVPVDATPKEKSVFHNNFIYTQRIETDTPSILRGEFDNFIG